MLDTECVCYTDTPAMVEDSTAAVRTTRCVLLLLDLARLPLTVMVQVLQLQACWVKQRISTTFQLAAGCLLNLDTPVMHGQLAEQCSTGFANSS